MSGHRMTRSTVGMLIVALTYTPILGSMTGTLAAAQAVQDTTSSYLYDANGNLRQIADPLGRKTDRIFDPLNQVTQEQQPLINNVRPTIKYGYDGLGQLATVTDPRNQITSFGVNGLGDESTLASPDTGTKTKTYDAAGNLLTSTDARGKTTTYSYDALNRVTRIAYATGVATVFEYDGGASGAPNAAGHLTRITDESGQTAYTYNPFGQLLTTVSTIGSTTYSLSYTYGESGSATGKRTSMTYPSGNRVNYAYDAAGRIASQSLNPVAAGDGTDTATEILLLRDITHAPFGAVTGWTWGNSTAIAPYTYVRGVDLDGRVTSYPLGTGTANGVQRTLAYDAASRISSTTHATPSGPSALVSGLDQTYGYDALDRLTSFVDASSNQAFQYDASGNRTQATFGASSYSNIVAPTSNRLLSAGGPGAVKSYNYDAAGNVLGDGTNTFTYSDRGRMRSANTAAGLVTYLFNGLDQRVRKSGPGNTVDYIYDEAGQLLAEYSGVDVASQETVYLGDVPVAVLKSSAGPATAVHHVFADHINTPRVITRAADGAIVWRWDNADPFGLTAPIQNASGVDFIYNPRFPGQVYDQETNFHYNYYRDYDPQTGRYLQSDPLGLGGGINTYGYANSNPITKIDPTGEIAVAAAIPYIVPPILAAYRGYRSYQAASAIASAINQSNVKSQTQACSASGNSDNKDPCDEIRRKIRDLRAQLSKREKDLHADQYDLFNRAHSVNPGGDIAGKGTYSGHVDMVNSVRRGLQRLEAQAKAMGCL